MIIDNTQIEFEDIPETLNNEVLLERPDAGGFITCPQEIAYLFAVATLEQKVFSGHDLYDYTGLNLTTCKKPDIDIITAQYTQIAQEKINSLNLPEQAKAGLQNRIDNASVVAQSLNLDDALRLALQLPIDAAKLG